MGMFKVYFDTMGEEEKQEIRQIYLYGNSLNEINTLIRLRVMMVNRTSYIGKTPLKYIKPILEEGNIRLRNAFQRGLSKKLRNKAIKTYSLSKFGYRHKAVSRLNTDIKIIENQLNAASVRLEKLYNYIDRQNKKLSDLLTQMLSLKNGTTCSTHEIRSPEPL